MDKALTKKSPIISTVGCMWSISWTTYVSTCTCRCAIYGMSHIGIYTHTRMMRATRTQSHTLYVGIALIKKKACSWTVSQKKHIFLKFETLSTMERHENLHVPLVRVCAELHFVVICTNCWIFRSSCRPTWPQGRCQGKI